MISIKLYNGNTVQIHENWNISLSCWNMGEENENPPIELEPRQNDNNREVIDLQSRNSRNN